MTATWKQLNLTHNDFDPDHILKMALLYAGGYQIRKNARLFLPRLSSESDVGYKERLLSTAYVPFLSEFIDFYTSFLFSEELHVKESVDKEDQETLGEGVESEDFWKLFSANCDLNDNSLHQFAECLFLDALVQGKAFVGVDFPKIDIEVTNRLEEEQSGKDRAYLYRIDNTSLIDWKYRPDYPSKFQWVKLRNEILIQEDPLAEPMRKFQFICWRLVNGLAQVEVFETRLLKLNELPLAEETIPSISTQITDFQEIPVFELCIDEGLSLGAKIGPLCEEHYQRRSLKNTSENKALIAIPVVYLGPNIPAVGGAVNENQEDSGRGDNPRGQFNSKGFVALGSEDKMEIVETKGTAHAQMEHSLEKLEHLMLQTVHQMANAAKSQTSASQASRSAATQQEARFQTEIILSAYSTIIREFVKELYNCIAAARNESVVWVVGGLTTDSPPDPQEVIQKALLLPQLDIPSVSFKKKVYADTAFALLDSVSVEERQQIINEIDEGVEGMQDQHDLEQQIMSGHQPPSPAAPKAPPGVQGPKLPEPKLPEEGQGSEKVVGDSGNVQMPENGHLQTGAHIDWRVVRDSISNDYKPEDMEWMKYVAWRGPIEVPTASVDDSLSDMWTASKPGKDGQDKVDMFADKIADQGQWKPVILTNNPATDEKFQLIDGRHRFLAAKKLGINVLAYVGDVGSNDPDTDHMQMHARQIDMNSGKPQKS